MTTAPMPRLEDIEVMRDWMAEVALTVLEQSEQIEQLRAALDIAVAELAHQRRPTKAAKKAKGMK